MKKENKREKINPLIKKQKKIKNIKVDNSVGSEDENTLKNLIIIVIVIAVIIGIVYAVTELVKKDATPTDEIVSGEINYDKISVGTMLNRPYDKYYVLIYNADDAKAVLYSTILTKYMSKEKSEKIYFCDLSNRLNAEYYNINNDNKSNPKATKVEDFNFGDLTLIKVEKGKITKYTESLEEIKEILN